MSTSFPMRRQGENQPPPQDDTIFRRRRCCQQRTAPLLSFPLTFKMIPSTRALVHRQVMRRSLGGSVALSSDLPQRGAFHSSSSRDCGGAARRRATAAPLHRSWTTVHSSVPDASLYQRQLSSSATEPAVTTPIDSDISVADLTMHLTRAAAWNHGQEGKDYDKSLWDVDFCRQVAHTYDRLLVSLSSSQDSTSESLEPLDPDQQADLLSAETVNLAFKVLLKCHYEPHALSTRVRAWERCLGILKQTPLTDHLSLRLLTANGKAGNVGRTLSLLQLRKSRGYRPRRREFVHAITSLQAANVAQRESRNIFISDVDQPAIDNPTRWLDAILLNMSERDYALTPSLANRMLDTYSAGRTGKAVHHFYRIVRHGVTPPHTPVSQTDAYTNTDHPASRVDTSAMPRDWFAFPGAGYSYKPIRVKVQYNRSMPPFYKVPAQVRGKLLYRPEEPEVGQLKLDRENEPEYSIPLAAAFAFAESLQHGACGHEGIRLNKGSYNALIKACVHRGALWRAMHLVDVTMPAADIPPNVISYNLVLSALAAVGDVVVTQEYYTKMLNAGLLPNAFTVRAIVDGLLNMGDVQGTVTVVQDFFNQHSVLPPYTTHTKILEFCLGRELLYEAKRYVYFIQQLWRWEPNQYHDESFIKLMRATQRNTQLQKPALQQLFAYFGEELTESDFLP